MHDYLYYSIKLKTVGTGDDAEAKLFVSDYTELQGFEQAIYNMDFSASTVGNISAELDMTISVYSNEGDFDDATASGEYYAVLTMSYSGIEARVGVIKIEYKKDGAYQNVIVFGETYVIDIMGNLVKKS